MKSKRFVDFVMFEGLGATMEQIGENISEGAQNAI